MRRAATLLLLAAGCTRTEPPAAPPPELPAARLLGYRLLRGEPGALVPELDPEAPPLIQLAAPPPAGLRIVLSGGAEVVPPLAPPASRMDVVLLRVAVPEGAGLTGAGEVRLELEGRIVQRWPVLWRPAPTARAALAPAVRLRAEGRLGEAAAALAAARPTMDADDRLWAAVEEARILQQRGDLAAATAAWESAAVVAREAKAPTEEARRLCAAAFNALWRRRFDEARTLLAHAERVNEAIADPIIRVFVEQLQAQVDEQVALYRRASDRLQWAVSEAWRLGLDPQALASSTPLAMLLQEQGRHDEALRTLAEAERFLADAPQIDRVTWLTNRAWVQLRAMAAGARPLAVAEPRRALTTAHALARARGERHHEANILVNLAWAALLDNDLPEARRNLDAARAADPERGIHDVFAALLDGDLHLLEGSPALAIEAFARAEMLAREEAAGGDSDSIWRAIHGRGRAHLALGDFDAARHAFDDALARLERLGRRTPLNTSRATFFADRRRLIEDAARLALARGAPEEAFRILDAAHAHALRALEAQARLDALPPEQEEGWSRRVGAWLAARQQYEASRNEGATLVGAELAAWQAQREQARQDLARLFDEAYDFLESRGQSRLPDTDVAALLAALTPDEALLAFAQVGDGWLGFRLADGRVDVTGPTADPLTPFLADLERRRHVYVVDGGLPAARTLHRHRLSDGAVLGERLSVAFLPYAGLLGRRAAHALGAPLVVADANGNLPHARREGRAIATALGDARLLAGLDARRPAVLAALDEARLFHFAGHGVLHPSEPWDAHLKMAGDEALTLADVLVAAPRLGLVVLSGCETGAVRALSAYERIGLPEAFLAIGARAVLATDEVVDDRAASRFVEAFYRHGGGTRPAEALRDAVAELRRAGDDAAWRPWRLVGRR